MAGAQQQQQQQPPDVNAQIAALTQAVGQLAQSQQGIVESIGKLATAQQQPPPSPAAGAKADDGKAKPVTADDVARIVTESLKTYQQGAQQQQARSAYQGDKLKDLPAVYRDRLGGDPAKWAAEEQAIREQYKADFKGAGGKVEDLGGTRGAAGDPPRKEVDVSKLSPTAALAQIMTEEKAGGGAAAATAAK